MCKIFGFKLYFDKDWLENLTIDRYCEYKSFAEQIVFVIDMFNYRLNRLYNIDLLEGDKMECQMVIDATLVLFRALFLESRDKSFSVQNFYILFGRTDIAEKIDEYLQLDYYSENIKADGGDCIPIKKFVKYVIDKFICHLDSDEEANIGICNGHISQLINKYSPRNIYNIVEDINNIIYKNLTDTNTREFNEN